MIKVQLWSSGVNDREKGMLEKVLLPGVPRVGEAVLYRDHWRGVSQVGYVPNELEPDVWLDM